MGELNHVLVCSKCKYSTVSFDDRVAAILLWSKIPTHSYRCTKRKETTDTFCSVTGNHIKESYYPKCSDERYMFNPDSCGPEAKYWSPKHKKDLFLILTEKL